VCNAIAATSASASCTATNSCRHGFCPLTWRESLRDIETCLRALGSKLYHSGIANPPPAARWPTPTKRATGASSPISPRSSSNSHDALRHEPFAAELQQAAYALDSTTIDLCLSLFPWATSADAKPPSNSHVADLAGQLSHRGYSHAGQRHDVNILDQLVTKLVPFTSWIGAIWILPAASPPAAFGFLCHPRQEKLPLSAALLASGGQEHRSAFRPDRGAEGFYAQRLTRNRCAASAIAIRKRQGLVFLTNNFTVPALAVARLYHSRWQIELFFNGSSNICASKLSTAPARTPCAPKSGFDFGLPAGAILKKRLHLDLSLYTMLQILSLTLFEKTPLLQAFSQQPPQPNCSTHTFSPVCRAF